jgi:UDP-N-acetyl-D-mannosaminuronate dehydrogenase
MNHCVIGHKGEVGTAVYSFLGNRGELVFGVEIGDGLPTNVDIIHVCIPYSDNFVKVVKEYARKIRHKNIIIYSSVYPGTTKEISKEAVHSPIEGRHPELYKSFTTFTRFLAGKKAEEIAKFFNELGLQTKCFKEAKTTELGKLLSTTRYGMNLMFTDEQQSLCKRYKTDYADTVIEYLKMYNQGYSNLGLTRFVQPLLTPPKGKIGGHCIVSNARLLFEHTKNKSIGRLAKYG